jgi:signal-transduction protein with cAMP-binding, CBS, and nucleotidyltransferase domain
LTFAGRGETFPYPMSTAAQILEGKERRVLSIDADATVYEAVERMVGANVGSLLVEVDGRINGIFTERDYLRRVTLEGRTDKESTVREIMTSPLLVVSPETSLEECMSLMTERRIRHLPVAEGGKVIGLISIGDVVKFNSKQQSYQLQYLNDYISAR